MHNFSSTLKIIVINFPYSNIIHHLLYTRFGRSDFLFGNQTFCHFSKERISVLASFYIGIFYS